MTALIFSDEVVIERNPTERSAACSFQFKGHCFHLKHRMDKNHRGKAHHMTCFIDEQQYTFGVARSTLGVGSYGNWPKRVINGEEYQWQVHWPNEAGRYGMRFGIVNTSQAKSDE
jgi:hypothetical protein